MKRFDQYLEEDIAQYEGRHDDLIFQTPAFYRLMVHLLDDARLPQRLRPLVLATIAYFVLPVDIIPEEIEGPYGYVDDLFLCAATARQVSQELKSDDILTENWDGECPLLPLLQDIMAREQELVGDARRRMMRYIGF